jgi:hypothetical protein
MLRIAFTIVFNGAHHLLHNDFIANMAGMFDYWIVVEGLALPGGSTNWCRDLSGFGYASTDGTRELLIEASKEHGNVLVVLADRPWMSKDEMVNKAISVIKSEIGVPEACFLHQVDSDECWEIEDLEAAERELIVKGGDCGCLHAEFYVGPGLVCRGTWGEGNAPDNPLCNAYRRLWRWSGQQFCIHEPPTLEGGNGREILLRPRFQHFSYYFEKDISFKEKYYRGYEGLLQRWTNLQKELIFPQSISYLLTDDWAKTATQIVRIDR